MIWGDAPNYVGEGLDAEGERFAGQGVTSYVDWLRTLTSEQKETVRHKHKTWSSIAKEADKCHKP